MWKRPKPVAGLAALLSMTLVMAGARAETSQAEVIHWWTSGSEAAAVKVLAEAFGKAGGEWVDTAIAGGGGANARMVGLSRIAGGQPPTAMQFSYGRQLDALVAIGYGAQLDAVAREGNWKKTLPPAIYDALVRAGHVYGVPVNIHGVNWTWWSADALARIGAQPPVDWPGFLNVLDRLKGAGTIPLALGGESWQEGILFDFVLLATGGKELFEALYRHHDDAVIRGPRFRAAAEAFVQLKGYVDEGSPGRSWNDTTAMVISGRAGVQIMGDWAKGEFQKAGQAAPGNYHCRLGLGDESPMEFIGDLFVMLTTTGAPASPVQELLARTMLSPQVQLDFNAVKGSIPVRMDADMSRFDACARASFDAIHNEARSVPGPDFTNSTDQVGAYRDAVTTLWNSTPPDIEAFVARMAKAASM